MAEIPVSFLLDKLTFLVQAEGQLLRGVPADVVYIKDEFACIKVFLRVTDGMEENDPELKVRVEQVREVSYDIEDALDDYLRLRLNHNGRGFSASLRKLSSCIMNLKALHRIASEMQDIKSRVASISMGHQNYCNRNNIVAQAGSSSLITLAGLPRRCPST
ncbi:hypothetical protein SLA2020_262780 [Shorea laevis]